MLIPNKLLPFKDFCKLINQEGGAVQKLKPMTNQLPPMLSNSVQKNKYDNFFLRYRLFKNLAIQSIDSAPKLAVGQPGSR